MGPPWASVFLIWHLAITPTVLGQEWAWAREIESNPTRWGHSLAVDADGNACLNAAPVVVETGNGRITSSPASLWIGPATEFVSKTMLSNGWFQVDFVGEPGRLYRIQACTDPLFISPVTITNFYFNQGLVRIIDFEGGHYSKRFYRAVD